MKSLHIIAKFLHRFRKIGKVKYMKAFSKILYVSTFFALTLSSVSSQTASESNQRRFFGTVSSAMVDEDAMDMSGFAEEDFRRGVQAYYRGAFNDSILQFEKALSYLPNENLILDWLGKAYYRAGIEGTAIQQWQYASDSGYGGLLLKNRIEIVSERRVTGAEDETSLRYTESGSFQGKVGDKLIFSQPISALPNSDGTVWIVAYGSNELIKVDVNGMVLARSRGALNGFDRPMDIIRASDGKLIISERAGNRISVFNETGLFEKSFGSKGRGVGQFIGPQYLAQDSSGNIYVTDFGNARVVVFDSEGNGLFCFGQKNADFKGLKGPTGIAVVDDDVFVADCVTGAIYHFDRAGNYEGLLTPEKTFMRPESMKNWGEFLIVSDSNKIYTVDTLTGSTFENASTGNAPSRITSAIPDINGNILVTDIKSNEVYVMSKMTELVGGLFVQIERVGSDSFPHVQLEVKVENRNRQPIVGLKDENFFISENKVPALEQTLTGAAYVSESADFTLLIDRSLETSENAEALKTAVREISSAMDTQATVRIVSVGSIPTIEYTGNAKGLSQFDPAALRNQPSQNCALDLGIRLAANDLVNAQRKRGIIFLTAGKVGQNAFSKYSLSDLTAYLNNNSISFSVVNLMQGSLAAEISYIVSNTQGDEYYVYRESGLQSVVSDIIHLPSGIYTLYYTSALNTNFGHDFLPVEVEAYLLNKSGRDESGYFAPLQ